MPRPVPHPRPRLGVEPLEDRATPSVTSGTGFTAPLTTSGPANGQVVVFTPIPFSGQFNTTRPTTIIPFPGFTGQVRTAWADVNADNQPDLIAVTGPGGPTGLVVFDGRNLTAPMTATIDPFGDPNFTGGAFVSAADIDNDGRAEIVVSPDQGGGPRVVVLSVVGAAVVPRRSFFGIDDPSFRGGARVAVGDFNADGFGDVAVAAGFLGGPRVSVYDGRSMFTVLGDAPPAKLVPDFFAFDGPDAASLRNGVFIASGDIDADGFDDLVFGGGPGGGPRVLVLSGRTLTTIGVAQAQGTPLLNFFAGDPNGRGGVRVAAKPVGSLARSEVVAASGENTASQVRVYFGTTPSATGEPTPFQTIDPYAQVLPGGIYVG
jgi:hypothetical protein